MSEDKNIGIRTVYKIESSGDEYARRSTAATKVLEHLIQSKDADKANRLIIADFIMVNREYIKKLLEWVDDD